MENPVLIIGNGALGTGLAAQLTKFGLSVRLMGRRGSIEQKACIQFGAGSAESSPESFHFPALRANELPRISLVFVAVKAYHFEAALAQHLPFFKAGTCIVPVGNGAIDDILNQASTNFPNLTFRLGISTLAVSREKELFSIRSESFKIAWGAFTPPDAPPSLMEKGLFEQSPQSPFQWLTEPFEHFRKKWLFNATLNSIVGLKNLKTNGGVLKNPKMLMMVFSEAYALAEEHWGPWSAEPEPLFGEFLDLVEKTSQNENSMSADRRNHRPTETDFLAGLSLRYSSYPILKQIHERLKIPLEPKHLPRSGD